MGEAGEGRRPRRSAFLYFLGEGGAGDRPVLEPGFKCLLEESGEGEWVVIAGGRARPGLRVRVRCAVDNAPLTLTGRVRAVEYREESNRSLLRIAVEEGGEE